MQLLVASVPQKNSQSLRLMCNRKVAIILCYRDEIAQLLAEWRFFEAALCSKSGRMRWQLVNALEFY